MDWVKCSERLPELEQEVLVCKQDDGLVLDHDMLFWFQSAGIQWCSLPVGAKEWEYWAAVPDDFFPNEYTEVTDEINNSDFFSGNGMLID